MMSSLYQYRLGIHSTQHLTTNHVAANAGVSSYQCR